MSRTFGPKHPQWNGGTSIHSAGYRLIRVGKGYKLEHRIIMERHIGRPLRKDEDVHHINHVKTDNRIENLQLITKTDHSVLHHTKYAPKKCEWCEKKPKQHRQRFCSRKCFGLWWSKNDSVKKRTRVSIYAALRCHWCKAIFKGSSAKKKFCSRSCYVRFWTTVVRPRVEPLRRAGCAKVK